VSGLVFGVALTLVVFAGADLLTSAMMIAPQGALMRAVRWRAIGTIVATFVANLVGALIFAVSSRVGRAARQRRGGQDALRHARRQGARRPRRAVRPRHPVQRPRLPRDLDVRARALRRREDPADLRRDPRLHLLGLRARRREHDDLRHRPVQRRPNATWGLFANNLLWVGLGNLVGGALVVGVGYWVIGGRRASLPAALRKRRSPG
jgi:nitrite transporter NirC